MNNGKLRKVLVNGFVIVFVVMVTGIYFGRDKEDDNTFIKDTVQVAKNQVKESFDDGKKQKEADETIDSINSTAKNVKDKATSAVKNVVSGLSGNKNESVQSSQDENETYQQLAAMEPQPDAAIIELNGNKSQLSEQEKEWKGPQIQYSPLDEYNRAQTAIGYLTKENLGKSSGRASQKWQPTGWHQQPQVNGKRKEIYNRGHLIAYTLSFNLNDDGQFVKGETGSIDNPKNLFTQTAQSNKVSMQKYEEMVRQTLAQNKNVIYRVQPVFRGSEKMARGVWLQGYTPDDDGETLDFNVYLFNTQPDFTFDYETGANSRTNS